MKRLILQILLISVLIFSTNVASASESFLNAILLEGSDKGYNIVLRSDKGAKVKKKVSDSGILELTIKGLTASSNISTLYRNVSNVNSFVVENSGEDTVKVYIQAPNISKSNIIFETPDASPMPVHNDYTAYKFIAGVGILCLFAFSSKKKQEKDVKFDLSVRDREMRLLRKYRNEITTIPSINYRVNEPYYANTVARKAETIRKMEYLDKV